MSDQFARFLIDVMARLLELGGLNCPPAVEEIELFADAEDERLLASGHSVEATPKNKICCVGRKR